MFCPAPREARLLGKTSADSRRLVTLDRLTSAEPLYRVLQGGELTLTLTRPAIDCSLDDDGQLPRLLTFLATELWLRNLLASLVGVDSLVGSPEQPSLAAAAAATAAAVAPAPAGEAATAAVAAGRADASPPDRPTSSSGSGSGSSTSPGVPSHPILTTASSHRAAEAQAAADAAAAAAGASPAATAPSSSSSSSQQLSPLRRRLTQVDASTHFSAEVRLPQLLVFVPDGELLTPAEVKAAVGEHLHITLAYGSAAVEELAEELEEDSSWLDKRQYSHQQQGLLLLQQQEQQGGRDLAISSSSKDAPWVIPPDGLSKRAWASCKPFMLQVSGNNVSALARGWRTGAGQYLLQQPLSAAWEFTPELSRMLLAQFNPLLDEVGCVKGASISTTFAPTQGLLHTATGQVMVSPLKLVVGKGQLLRQVYELLHVSEETGLFRRHRHHQHQSSSSSSTPDGQDQQQQQQQRERERRRHHGDVEVWSGPLLVDIQAPGQYTTQRVDMLIGSGSAALHVALWGHVDVLNDALHMKLGLPASTLARTLGIRHLPPSYLLPVSVSGSLSSPQIEWATAARRLAVLSAMQVGRGALRGEVEAVAEGAAEALQERGGWAGLLPGLFGAANRALSHAASSFIGQVDERLQQELLDVPPATELPWEQPQQHSEREQTETGTSEASPSQHTEFSEDRQQ